MSYQKVTGPLMASGYQKNGTQEAMNDMYVTMWDGSEVAPTLTARNAGGGQRMPDKDNFNHVLSLAKTSAMTEVSEDRTGTLVATEHKDPTIVGYGEEMDYIVRRLTPTECARLQGMPDWWCRDIPHADSAEYKMWGNGMALPNILYVMQGVKGKTLGSLFDGAGTCPLAAKLCGIEPKWASEIEKFPIQVTSKRFPDMKHLGDVTKIKGSEIEPVDIITFGSPCQDLSVAGKGAGLGGERSGLFHEAIRIVKEMRDATGIYPRELVWENVPGAKSSNKGFDFLAVLQAFCSIKDSNAHVPEPERKAGKLVWSDAGLIVGDGYSVEWRTFDAQYWGVPQRRKRIYAYVDLNGDSRGQVLFERDGVYWDTAEKFCKGEIPAGDFGIRPCETGEDHELRGTEKDLDR